MNDAVRVLIADDHAPTRADLRAALDEAGSGFTVVAEAADAPGAVSGAVAEAPDLCLLDVQMPGSGLAAAWEITARLPDVTVVMLTVSASDAHLFGALRAGARGYLLKDIDNTRLRSALRAAIAGEAVLPGRLAARVVATFRDRGPRRRALVTGASGPQLTPREWEVLELLRDNRTTAQIASELVVSEVTVRSHVAAVMRKLRVPDRRALVQLFDA